MALDRSGKALADRDARNLDLLARFERLDGDRFSDWDLGHAAELDQMAMRREVRLLQVPDLALDSLRSGTGSNASW